MGAACQDCAVRTLNAKRLHAHKHFKPRSMKDRARLGLHYHELRRPTKDIEKSWAASTGNGGSQVVYVQTRTAAVTTDCIWGVVLRDGVPLVLHSDHAGSLCRSASDADQSVEDGHDDTGASSDGQCED